MRSIVAFAAGVLFALGLVLSGMTDPARVTAFLDVTGHWDPSLALVMASAIGVYLPGYLLIRRRARPFAGTRFAVPPETPVDRSLLGGAVVFGLGWGLVGLCPGPAIASLATYSPQVWLFVGGIVLGMVAYERRRALAARPAPLAELSKPTTRSC